MKFPWTKTKTETIVTPMALPEKSLTPIQMGDWAQGFIASEVQWEFFVMFCQQVRDVHLNAEPDKDKALQNYACACLMRSLPNKVVELVHRRDRMKQAMIEQQERDLSKQFAGRNGTRVASRPMSA